MWPGADAVACVSVPGMEETTEESTPTAADLVEAQDGPNNDEHIRLAAVMRDRDSLRSHVNRMRHNLANELAVQRELLSQDISPGPGRRALGDHARPPRANQRAHGHRQPASCARLERHQRNPGRRNMGYRAQRPPGMDRQHPRHRLTGRNIFYREVPAHIDRVLEDQQLLIISRADGKSDSFPPPVYQEPDDMDEDPSPIMTSIDDKNIWWWRK